MTPVILMTAQASLQSAIGAVNSGAFYYIQKPFSNDELVAILRRACEFRAVRVENKQLKQEIRRRDKSTVTRPIGKSKRFLELLKLAEHVAPTDSTVLIQGESGTGKEVVARYVHNLSTRTDGPVPLDQLRRAAREPARERAVRPREGRVHRRGARQAGPLRRGAGRQLLPRRGRRDAAVAAGQAAPRAAGAGGDPGRRHRGDPGGRPRSSPPPTATSRRRSGGATSARTCSTASTSSRSTCRRCASAGTTCCC